MDNANSFPDPEVISRYSDRQAVEDGVLVAISARDRVTTAAFHFLAEHTPMTAQPPSRWPVDLFGWFSAGKRATEKEQRDQRAVALAVGMISTNARKAKDVYEKNIGGGIFQLWPTLADDKLTGLSTTGNEHGVKFWILPNENGGMTLMFPEDY